LCICSIEAIKLLLLTAILTLYAIVALGMFQTPPGMEWGLEVKPAIMFSWDAMFEWNCAPE
jgi:hypothetical protein